MSPDHPAAVLPPGFRRLALATIDSTNDEARRLAEAGRAEDGLIVTATSQTGGRGRRGRVWVSPVGNLHLSLLIARTAPLARSAELGFVAAAALAEALAGLVPAAAFRCKWPNDVLCRPADGDGASGSGGFAKTAGMLLESAGDDWLVLGIGIDVAAAPPPDTVMQAARSLADLGWHGGTEPVLAAFCAAFAPLLAAWRAEGFAPVRRAWLERAHGLGEPVLVRLEAETLSGRFAALDEDGALVLDQGPAGRRRVLAGDVFFPGA